MLQITVEEFAGDDQKCQRTRLTCRRSLERARETVVWKTERSVVVTSEEPEQVWSESNHGTVILARMGHVPVEV